MPRERYWSRFASDFEERNNYVVGKDDMNLVFKEISRLKKLGSTLELASGNGTYSRILNKNSESLIATDFSIEMVEESKRRMPSSDSLTIEQADAFNLSYPDSSFDTLFLANLLHVVSSPEKIIEEGKRVLKNGGQIIIVDFTMDGVSFFNKLSLIFRYLKTYGKPSKEGQNLTLSNIEEMLIESKFNIRDARLIGNDMKAVLVIAEK